MKITGLLTKQEAIACEKAGYQGLPWPLMAGDPDSDGRMRWVMYHRSNSMVPSAFAVSADEEAFKDEDWHFLPPEGAWLPMETAPKDGRPVVVFTRSSLHPAISIAGRVTSGFWWNVVDGWMIENLSYADRHILGWRPYVKVEED